MIKSFRGTTVLSFLCSRDDKRSSPPPPPVSVQRARARTSLPIPLLPSGYVPLTEPKHDNTVHIQEQATSSMFSMINTINYRNKHGYCHHCNTRLVQIRFLDVLYTYTHLQSNHFSSMCGDNLFCLLHSFDMTIQQQYSACQVSRHPPSEPNTVKSRETWRDNR